MLLVPWRLEHCRCSSLSTNEYSLDSFQCPEFVYFCERLAGRRNPTMCFNQKSVRARDDLIAIKRFYGYATVSFRC